MENPKIILVFSGKRKSGKDYLCEKLKHMLGEDRCCLLRISEPLKRVYARDHNLDLEELLSDGPYKEIHRHNMIKWSEEIRETDPGIFCKAACEKASDAPIWIVCDIRRKTDIKWFKETYGQLVKSIRISADIEVRKNRGWIFTKDVDDAPSECNLDDFEHWDLQVSNNSSEDSQNTLKKILELVPEY
ncbi:phosphomevalonate kinase [Diabrotica virgifera virgifera]|uniref:Phosphomevalonate kinase n=1 Tax=Diabrotica virgifera virgifera TaxID=50390 RepID=A0A6P7GEN0_DIAVI|nr:phosphomevalonate kinase [Diabrotica virgifera virgifera]